MKSQIKVIVPDGLPEFFDSHHEIHISSNGVLCIKNNYNYVKAYAAGNWETAEVVTK